jgi:hypothetical protein
VSERKSGGVPVAHKSPPSGTTKRTRPSSRSELPRVQTTARLPSAEARATGKTVTLGEGDAARVESIMAALPDPTSLGAGTVVIVPGDIASPSRSLARSVLAVFGRAKTVSRAHRCSALVARGYVDVGAGEDESRADLAWGYAPRTSASPVGDHESRSDEA